MEVYLYYFLRWVSLSCVEKEYKKNDWWLVMISIVILKRNEVKLISSSAMMDKREGQRVGKSFWQSVIDPDGNLDAESNKQNTSCVIKPRGIV